MAEKVDSDRSWIKKLAGHLPGPGFLPAVVQLWSAEQGWPAAAAAAVSGVSGLGEATPLTPALRALVLAGPMPSPSLLGPLYEVGLARRQRRGGGVFYTPADVADRLTAMALEQLPGGNSVTDRAMPPLVVDPACGGGAFLLAAARHLALAGYRPERIVSEALWGAEVSAEAARVCRLALGWWCWSQGGAWPDGDREPTIKVADALLDAAAWPDRGADLVVGNPPFLNQLETATARDPDAVEALRRRFGAVASGYVDTAALFLVAAMQRCASGGRVVLIQPESTLVAAHAAGVRSALAQEAQLSGVWFGGGDVFAAGVRVCALRLDRRVGSASETAGPTSTRPVLAVAYPCGRWIGPKVERCAPLAATATALTAETWGALAQGLRGAPTVRLATSSATLASLATATAGFRDQFYGLIPFVQEGGDGAPLVTSGVIDVLHCAWGVRACRFAGRRWLAPTVEVERLDAENPRLAAWVRARLVPKVVVAAQSAVVEAVIDASGGWVPSVPVISVEAPLDRLALIAAVLSAPPISAYVLDHYGGAALSGNAVKLSARQVLALPLPADHHSWVRAAELITGLDTVVGRSEWEERRNESARLLCAAYGVDPSGDVMTWWFSRVDVASTRAG